MAPRSAAPSWAPAALIAAVVAASVALGGQFLLDAGLRQSGPTLEEASKTGAMAVGQAVAAQFAYALELGIPLDKMPGVDAYLKRTVATSPQVEGLALLDADGRIIAATGDRVEGNRFTIAGGGAEAELVVASESPFLAQAVRQMRIGLAVTALFAGMLAWGIVAYFFAFRYEPARRKFLDDLEHIASGDFDVRPVAEDRGPIGVAAGALARCLERVAVARRTLLEAVATIRAIDFDGSLGRQVDAILRPIEERYRFAQGDDAEAATAEGSAWRVGLVLCLYSAAFAYVANFAIDREPEWLAEAWIPVLPLAAELAAALAGAVLACTRVGRSGAALAAACLILAGCLAGTYWCREYETFVLLRAGSGFAGAFAVAGFLAHRPIGIRRGELVLLAIFAMLAAGPLLSGIYAEAIGRRSGFLMLGLAMLVATPFILAGDAATVSPSRRSSRLPPLNHSDLLLGLAVLPAGAMALVVLPAWISYDDYLLTGVAVAAMGVCAFAVPALSAVICAAALLLAALALVGGLLPPVVATIVGCALLGLAAGGAVKSFGTNRPWAALAAGTALGLAAAGLAAQFRVDFATVPAAVAVLLAGCWLLTRRPADSAPA